MPFSFLYPKMLGVVILDNLLEKLNNTMEKVLSKLDDQGIKISELGVKVDLYREVQNQHERKLEVVDKVAAEALQSTKACHKRLDSVANDITWMKRLIIGGFVTMIFTVLGGIILASIKGLI